MKMAYRIQEQININDSRYFKIQKKRFGFFWADYDDTDFGYLSDAIKQTEIYRRRDERRKNPKIVYEIS